MKHRVITVCRAYGSGGRLIGREVAAKLGIAFYDKDIIKLTAKECGFSPDFIREHEQRSIGGLLSGLASQGFGAYSKDTLPPADLLFLAECKVLREIAQKEECVIVGRCSDYVLRDLEGCLHVFIRSTKEDCIHRVTTYYGIPQDRAAAEIKRMNRERAAHCKRYTDRTWGKAENYDMMLNTARFGIDGCVDLICAAAEKEGSDSVGDVY